MEKNVPSWSNVGTNSKRSWIEPVVRRADGGDVALPILAVRGGQPGPTLLLSAGVHGDEFEGMAALWQLHEELDPATLLGTLVCVPIVNTPAYEAGLRTNPHDRQDMARVFPGHPAGTVTEQLADRLTRDFFPHVDFYVDLHSAGQYYTMPPLVGYQLRPEPILSKQRAAAQAMGIPLVWGTPSFPGRSLSSATALGVPSLYVETTGSGGCRTEDVALYKQGLLRLLSHLGMSGQTFPDVPPRWIVEDDGPQAGFLQVQNRAPMGGFFDTTVRVLDQVRAGQVVGYLRDPLGQKIHEVTAAHNGLVVFLRSYPRVHAGEPLCTVVELK